MHGPLRDTVRIFAGLWEQPGLLQVPGFLSLVVSMQPHLRPHVLHRMRRSDSQGLGEGAPVGHSMGD